MSVNDAEAIINYMMELPEITSDGRFEKIDLAALTYLALERGNFNYLPTTDNIQNKFRNSFSSDTDQVTLEDITKYLEIQCDTVPNGHWTQVNGFYDSGGYNPFSRGEVGIKLHVSLPEDSKEAGLLGAIFAGLLNDMSTVYKIVKSESDWNTLNMGQQKGKAIAIYPETTTKSQEMADKLSSVYDKIYEHSGINLQPTNLGEALDLLSNIKPKPVELEDEIPHGIGVWIRPAQYRGENLKFDSGGNRYTVPDDTIRHIKGWQADITPKTGFKRKSSPFSSLRKDVLWHLQYPYSTNNNSSNPDDGQCKIY
ncbi:MAG: hypothetical protein KAH93_01130 [Candidatus Aenigmarchaeota archaeon]|nr:hypothetical protein [Candidatus Aenigmarchaeota archaeon]